MIRCVIAHFKTKIQIKAYMSFTRYSLDNMISDQFDNSTIVTPTLNFKNTFLVLLNTYCHQKINYFLHGPRMYTQFYLRVIAIFTRVLSPSPVLPQFPRINNEYTCVYDVLYNIQLIDKGSSPQSILIQQHYT